MKDTIKDCKDLARSVLVLTAMCLGFGLGIALTVKFIRWFAGYETPNIAEMRHDLDVLKIRMDALQSVPKITQGTALPQVIIGDPIYRGTKTNSLLFTTNQFILVH